MRVLPRLGVCMVCWTCDPANAAVVDRARRTASSLRGQAGSPDSVGCSCSAAARFLTLDAEVDALDAVSGCSCDDVHRFAHTKEIKFS